MSARGAIDIITHWCVFYHQRPHYLKQGHDQAKGVVTSSMVKEKERKVNEQIKPRKTNVKQINEVHLINSHIYK